VLLDLATLDGITQGRIDVVFRRWSRPTVKAGGRLRTRVGELHIVAVDRIEPGDIDDDDARRAGFAAAAEVVQALLRPRPAGRGRGPGGDGERHVYRVTVAPGGEDPRIARRRTLLSPEELDAMVDRLDSMDTRSRQGPWTRRSLELIAAWPARRAPDLAAMDAMETAPWKARIRRLKELGLTESLEVGYRLSPRGEQVLAELTRRSEGA
jgi:hypothetical protein